jgi:hypothetical protein
MSSAIVTSKCRMSEHRILSPKRYLLAKMVISRHGEMQIHMSAFDQSGHRPAMDFVRLNLSARPP